MTGILIPGPVLSTKSFIVSFSAQDVFKWAFSKEKSSFLSTCSEVTKTNRHISSAKPLKFFALNHSIYYIKDSPYISSEPYILASTNAE